MLVENHHTVSAILPDDAREPGHTVPPIFPDIARKLGHTVPHILPDGRAHSTTCFT